MNKQSDLFDRQNAQSLFEMSRAGGMNKIPPREPDKVMMTLYNQNAEKGRPALVFYVGANLVKEAGFKPGMDRVDVGIDYGLKIAVIYKVDAPEGYKLCKCEKKGQRGKVSFGWKKGMPEPKRSISLPVRNVRAEEIYVDFRF